MGGGGRGAPGTPDREEKGVGLEEGVSPWGAEACGGAGGLYQHDPGPGKGAGPRAGRRDGWGCGLHLVLGKTLGSVVPPPWAGCSLGV